MHASLQGHTLNEQSLSLIPKHKLISWENAAAIPQNYFHISIRIKTFLVLLCSVQKLAQNRHECMTFVATFGIVI